MTISFCKVNLSQIFCAGLAYVALSRVRSADDLQLVDVTWKKLDWVNSEAKNFYKNLSCGTLEDKMIVEKSDSQSSPLGKRTLASSSSEEKIEKKPKQESIAAPSSSTEQNPRELKSARVVLWYWQHHQNWNIFKNSAQIEAAYKIYEASPLLPTSEKFDISDTHYIDFKTMKQVNKKETWRTRKVKRDEQFIVKL